MKVLNAVMQNYIGGPQIRVMSVAEKLNAHDVETIILCPREEGAFADYARSKGFQVEQVFWPGLNNFNSFTSILKNIIWVLSIPVTVIQIFLLLRRENIDLVHVNGLLNFQAAVAAFLDGKSVVWHLMSSLYPPALVSVMMPLVKSLSSHMIVIAHSLGQYYLGPGFESLNQVSVVYEPVDTQRYNLKNINPQDIKDLKAELELNPEDVAVGCVANINFIKGYEYLLEAVSLIKSTLNNFKLIIVGDVPATQQEYYQKLIQLIDDLAIKDHILFLGRRDDIPVILSQLDIFVLPSLAEGTPLVILEAMALGKPIISTEVGAINEQVVNGVNGFLVPPKNPGALAEKMTDLIQNEELRIKMGAKSQEIVKKFTLDKCVQQHKSIYSKLIREK